MIVTNGSSTYEVGKRVAETIAYRIYLSVETSTGRQCLLQIAAAIDQNGGLDRTAYVLQQLEQSSIAAEASYAKITGDPGKRLSYNLLFPQLLDTFISREYQKRRINILAFRNVDDVSKMVPLSNLAAKDRLRVDLRTSAWIMGRLLKLLDFAHNQGIGVQAVSGNNILLEPKKHYMVLFDWSSARVHPGKVPREQRTDDIAGAARAVILALGGNPVSGVIPEAGEESRQYTGYLLRLAKHRESNAGRAHHRFYELVDGLWEPKYYPFTTKPLAG